MKSLSITLFWLFIIQVTHAQEVASEYQKWLASTPLGSALEVTSYQPQQERLTISVKKHLETADEVKSVYATWDSLSTAYSAYDLTLPNLLYNQLKQLVPAASGKLSITLQSPKPVLFSGSISYNGSEVVAALQFLSIKGSGIPTLKTEGLFFPSDFLPLKLSLVEARKFLPKQVQKFFRQEFKASKNEIQQEVNGKSEETYKLEKKGLVTENFNDRLVLTIFYSATSNAETQIHFSIKASYAGGIFAVGEYEEVGIDYLPALIELQQKFKNLLFNDE